MKKIIIICLVSILSIGILGCSNSNNKETSDLESDIANEISNSNAEEEIMNNVSDSKEETNETTNNVSDSREETGEDTLHFVDINLNETINTEFMEVTFTKIYTSFDLLPSDTSGVYSYHKGEEGSQYFILDGTIKNTGTFAQGFTNSVAKFIFDDKYIYNAEVYHELDNTSLYTTFSIDPFESTRIVIAQSIPDELLNQYSTVTIQWGLNDNFGYTDDNKYSSVRNLEKCTYLYELKAKK